MKITLVLMGWFIIAIAAVGSWEFGNAIRNHRDHIVTKTIWLPARYTHLNKQPNGTFFLAKGVSISGTAIDVALDDSFKSIATRAAENDVIITQSAIHYLAKNDGVVYHAAEPVYVPQGFLENRDVVGDVQILKDDLLYVTITAEVNADTVAILVVALFFLCFFVVLLFSPTQSIIRKFIHP